VRVDLEAARQRRVRRLVPVVEHPSPPEGVDDQGCFQLPAVCNI
jgi:hypothetical protein